MKTELYRVEQWAKNLEGREGNLRDKLVGLKLDYLERLIRYEEIEDRKERMQRTLDSIEGDLGIGEAAEQPNNKNLLMISTPDREDGSVLMVLTEGGMPPIRFAELRELVDQALRQEGFGQSKVRTRREVQEHLRKFKIEGFSFKA
ncbi:hypothetical protein [Cohnella thailandensis]|uniref:Uncharacterized protein n=1 Tax=Cohnella thailandensis TaxID=557557 RepID=A0A841T718_9BACL|nr:hypothetical protein [Cohnella thailandensis]MBB6637647.1 hypothetical protein [Cohnella thailandensis]MBP1974177.1 hypothetical protein [Cohnella thailandensis]